VVQGVVECVLFDFFGTLVDYTHGRTDQDFAATYDLVRSHGIELTCDEMVATMDNVFVELEAESRQSQREFSMQQAIARFLAARNEDPDDAFCEEMSARYVDDWAQHVDIPAGITTFLKRLSRTYQLGLITNTHYEPMISRFLGEMEIADVFKVVVTSIEHGRPKPHPDIFRHALKQMGATAEVSVYVGDSFDADYRGATGVGMPCYLIGRHARVPVSRQIPSVFELSAKLS
jgi:putative hydrolase of the HAD superfamily